MPTTPSPPLPQTCAPPSQPSTHCRPFSQERAHQSQARPTPANLAPTNPRQPATGPEQPALRPASLAPARLTLPTPASLASAKSPSRIIPGQAHACSQILTFRPLPIKPHVIFIGKGRFCLYLYTACKYKYPRHPLGAPGISVKDQSVHLMILVTRPEPTVRPPSRIAKPRPSSMAMGWIS